MQLTEADIRTMALGVYQLEATATSVFDTQVSQTVQFEKKVRDFVSSIQGL